MFKVSSLSGENGFFVAGYLPKLFCDRIIDTGVNVTIVGKVLAHNDGEKYIWIMLSVTIQSATSNSILKYTKNQYIFKNIIYHHMINDDK